MSLMLIITKNNICYKLGHNAKENFNLIDEATDINYNFWWFHLNAHPSGHCIVCCENLDEEIILFASNLVKSGSKLKKQPKVKIIYTQIKNIKKMKTIGEVQLLQIPSCIII